MRYCERRATCHHGHYRHAWSLGLQTCISLVRGYAVAQLVVALRCNPEDRGFDSRLCHWNFSWYSPSGRTMALGLTRRLTEMSTRNISWGGGGKGGRYVELTALPPSCAECLEIWEPQLLEPSGPVQACNGIALFYFLGPLDCVLRSGARSC